MQYVVGEAAADTRDGSLVTQHRVDVTAVVTVSDQRFELVAEWIRPQTRQGAIVTFRQKPPARLPVRSVLPDEK
jgi:hypothetical protein